MAKRATPPRAAPPAAQRQETLSSSATTTICGLLVLGMIGVVLLAPPGVAWLIVMLLMVAFLVTVGLRVTGRGLGVLINERNLMSLSRFQTALWTIVILSAYFTIAALRVRTHGVENPLDIAIDPALWALLGISTASLVGTPLIHSVKKQKEPEDADGAMKEVANKFGEEPDDVQAHREGVLYGNASPEYAAFTDMFEGDELKNTAYVDLAKVQMFFFTVIAGAAYAVALWAEIGSTAPDKLHTFPVLSEGLVALLGISHAGYLGGKSVNHTKTG